MPKIGRKGGMCLGFIALLVAALVIGIVYVYMSQIPLEEYNESETFETTDYPSLTTIDIYCDVCFHNVSFNIVENPGFIIEINWTLDVIKDEAVGKNTKLQVKNSSTSSTLDIDILKENPSDVCAFHAGDGTAKVMVTIDNDYEINLDALAGHGNINVTGADASFDDLYLHHGINCNGDNGIDLVDSTIGGDLTCSVSTGKWWVRLYSTIVVGTISCTPSNQGTLILVD